MIEDTVMCKRNAWILVVWTILLATACLISSGCATYQQQNWRSRTHIVTGYIECVGEPGWADWTGGNNRPAQMLVVKVVTGPEPHQWKRIAGEVVLHETEVHPNDLIVKVNRATQNGSTQLDAQRLVSGTLWRLRLYPTHLTRAALERGEQSNLEGPGHGPNDTPRCSLEGVSKVYGIAIEGPAD